MGLPVLGPRADRRLDEEREDEFGQVAVAFNTFANELVAYSIESVANSNFTTAA